MCFAPLPNALRPLHQILAQCPFSSFSTFFLDFLILTDEISTRSSLGWVLDNFLDRTWSYLPPKLFCNVNLTISWSPTTFSKNCQKPYFDVWLSLTRSSSGWVPMVRKVLPSKSMNSEEHFKYLQCPHISKS